MANGIRKSTLVSAIKRERVTVTSGEVASALLEFSGLRPMLLDSTYYAVPMFIWSMVLQYSGIDKARYVRQVRDCDDFAFAFRGEVPIKLGLNGVGVALDFGMKHAYNVLLVHDPISQDVDVAAMEPQTDKIMTPERARARGGLVSGMIVM